MKRLHEMIWEDLRRNFATLRWFLCRWWFWGIVLGGATIMTYLDRQGLIGNPPSSLLEWAWRSLWL